MSAMPAALPHPVPTAPRARRILVAEPPGSGRRVVLQELMDLPSISVERVDSRPELETAVRGGTADLVVAAAHLGPDSALEILARLRTMGDRTPFVVYSELRGSLMRVLVSDAASALLSSRVMSLGDLVDMIGALPGARRAAAR